ncbi:MAG: hypothetical protein NVS2B15_08800 [Pseudarthrobacter sp.]
MSSILGGAGVDVPEPSAGSLKETWSPGSGLRNTGTPAPWSSRPRSRASIRARADIPVTGNQLELTVRHEEKTEHKDKEGYRSECRYGTFSRTVTLPTAVDPG